ncbi:hypothetical protein ES703_79114 [subsurface metagenome]
MAERLAAAGSRTWRRIGAELFWHAGEGKLYRAPIVQETSYCIRIFVEGRGVVRIDRADLDDVATKGIPPNTP